MKALVAEWDRQQGIRQARVYREDQESIVEMMDRIVFEYPWAATVVMSRDDRRDLLREAAERNVWAESKYHVLRHRFYRGVRIRVDDTLTPGVIIVEPEESWAGRIVRERK